MFARLHNEGGFGLVELLIAMTVMSIAIFALVAGFSSSAGTLNRASKTATAGVVADKQMEAFHRLQYRPSPSGPPDTTTTGPDGRTYWVRAEVDARLRARRTLHTLTPTTCPDVATGRRAGRREVVTVTVRDGSSTGDRAHHQSSTFDQSTG